MSISYTDVCVLWVILFCGGVGCLVVALSSCAADGSVRSVAVPGLLGLLLIYAGVSPFFSISFIETHEEEVIESQTLAAFERKGGEGVNVSETGLNFLFYSSVSAEIDRDEDSYVVMVDEYGDGGLVEKYYPIDETRVYEDAAAETARVERVRITTERAEGTFLGIPVTGGENHEYETRIHVPEGTLEMARLATGDAGEGE